VTLVADDWCRRQWGDRTPRSTKDIPRGVPRNLPVWDIFLFYHPCQDRIVDNDRFVRDNIQFTDLPDAGMQNGETHDFVALVAHNYIIIR
jgi:hypothetical protein